MARHSIEAEAVALDPRRMEVAISESAFKYPHQKAEYLQKAGLPPDLARKVAYGELTTYEAVRMYHERQRKLMEHAPRGFERPRRRLVGKGITPTEKAAMEATRKYESLTPAQKAEMEARVKAGEDPRKVLADYGIVLPNRGIVVYDPTGSFVKSLPKWTTTPVVFHRSPSGEVFTTAPLVEVPPPPPSAILTREEIEQRRVEAELKQAGFTSSEIETLRANWRYIQATSKTPEEFRRRWMSYLEQEGWKQRLKEVKFPTEERPRRGGPKVSAALFGLPYGSSSKSWVTLVSGQKYYVTPTDIERAEAYLPGASWEEMVKEWKQKYWFTMATRYDFGVEAEKLFDIGQRYALTSRMIRLSLSSELPYLAFRDPFEEYGRRVVQYKFSVGEAQKAVEEAQKRASSPMGMFTEVALAPGIAGVGAISTAAQFIGGKGLPPTYLGPIGKGAYFGGELAAHYVAGIPFGAAVGGIFGAVSGAVTRTSITTRMATSSVGRAIGGWVSRHQKLVGATTVGIMVGVPEGLRVKEMADLGYPWEEIGKQVARDVAFLTGMGFGIVGTGPAVKGYIETYGRKIEVPAEAFIRESILTGKEQFPLYPRGTGNLLKAFRIESRKFSAEEFFGPLKRNLSRVYHATPYQFGERTVVLPGTSESPGLYVSASGSPHFLKVPGYATTRFGLPSWLWQKPAFVTLDLRVSYIPGWVKRTMRAMNRFLLRSGKAEGYISPASVLKGKPEVEAIIPVNVQLTRVSKDFYTTLRGVRISVDVFKVSGAKKGKPTFFARASSSSYRMETPVFSPLNAVKYTIKNLKRMSRSSSRAISSSISSSVSMVGYSSTAWSSRLSSYISRSSSSSSKSVSRAISRYSSAYSYVPPSYTPPSYTPPSYTSPSRRTPPIPPPPYRQKFNLPWTARVGRRGRKIKYRERLWPVGDIGKLFGQLRRRTEKRKAKVKKRRGGRRAR